MKAETIGINNLPLPSSPLVVMPEGTFSSILHRMTWAGLGFSFFAFPKIS
ncbi:MAG: hypothetical protein V2I33_20710 [Kangiellaceae bacterium]|nr:hypothetical protein [Kangiellaceae bacterium]